MATGGKDVSALGVGTMAAGALLVWSGLRGSSVLSALQDVIKGDKPSGANVHQIDAQAGTASLTSAGAGASGSVLNTAVQVANSPAGKRNYCWGGGHSGSPCSASCFDCSGYVSCVLNRLGLLKGSMVTTGFMTWSGATTVPYSQRQPGDLYVSASHIGIIASSTQMWNAACTACGPVKLSNYVGRSGYIVRRVKNAQGA
jgi:cell wall-associated NlpC family hydrolase